MVRANFFSVFTLALASLWVAPAQAQERVQASEYGDEWPFPGYDSGLLDCKVKRERPLVIIKLGDSWYGLSGAAKGMGGYKDARKKVAKHPEWGTYQLGATHDLIDRGQKMCGPTGDPLD